MANKQITDLTALAAQPADADWIVIRDADAGADKKIAASYFVTTTDGTRVSFTGGGTGVTVTGIQTLTNKTLTAPTIADFTNATHTHLTDATGGALDVYLSDNICVYKGYTAISTQDTSMNDDWEEYTSFWIDADKIPTYLTVKMYYWVGVSAGTGTFEIYDADSASAIGASQVTSTSTSFEIQTSNDMRAAMASGLTRYYFRMKQSSGVAVSYCASAMLVID